MQCTKCDSHRVEECRSGASVGAGAGLGAGGCYAASKLMSGSKGTGIFEIIGAFIGLTAAGVIAGSLMDGTVFENYKCNDCGHTFKAGDDPIERASKVMPNTKKAKPAAAKTKSTASSSNSKEKENKETQSEKILADLRRLAAEINGSPVC